MGLYAAAMEGPDFMGLPDKDRDKGITRGVVTCRGSMYCFEIDLNSDNDKIEYIMG